MPGRDEPGQEDLGFGAREYGKPGREAEAVRARPLVADVAPGVLRHLQPPEHDQPQVGHQVDPDAIAPGDLLFFTTVAPGASHVALAIGADEFVHAPSERGQVRVERLGSSYWSRRFLGARRIVSDAP